MSKLKMAAQWRETFIETFKTKNRKIFILKYYIIISLQYFFLCTVKLKKEVG